jgi:hypothetical protein
MRKELRAESNVQWSAEKSVKRVSVIICREGTTSENQTYVKIILKSIYSRNVRFCLDLCVSVRELVARF